MPPQAADYPILLFHSQAEWAAWLHENHGSAAGVWLQHAKKSADLQSVSYAAALETALCYGWIDGQKRAYNDQAWIQKWTPRGNNSIWSRINRDKAEALIAAGRMQPTGMAAIERARANGRWDAAYDGAKTATIPDDLQAELNAHPEAQVFFNTLNQANRYAILFRLQTAKKPETRAKRLREYIAMLERHETLYPQTSRTRS